MTDARPAGSGREQQVSVARLAVFVLGSLALFTPGVTVAAVVVWRQYLEGEVQPATDDLLWVVVVAIPLALLVATWLFPRRTSTERRAKQVESPGESIPVALYDDVRVAGVWVFFGLTCFLILAGMVLSVVALTNCSAAEGTCGTGVNRRFALVALIIAGSDILALAGARLLAQLPLAPGEGLARA